MAHIVANAHVEIDRAGFVDDRLLGRALLAFRTSGQPLNASERYHLYQLRAFLNRKVNSALSNPARAISDQLLTAVSICATLEVRQGNLEGYQVHMSGLRQMINLRGGFAELGRTDAYVGRFLLWQDANTSSVAGYPPYFDKENDDATIRAHLKPSPTYIFDLPPIDEDGP